MPVIPRRFGLKYGPQPTIAMEFKRENSGNASEEEAGKVEVLEVTLESLALAGQKADSDAIVAAICSAHGDLIDPAFVSMAQLKRLVERLLVEAAGNLPP
ncbi:unnamed protein product, partial [Phaeothamnion confervicola]